MTELTSSRLGAGFEMILMSSERRRVPVRLLEEAMVGGVTGPRAENGALSAAAF